MESRLLFKKRAFNSDKRALSTIVITVILIAISMAAIVLVWSFVSNMIKGQIKTSQSCFGNYDKIKLNGQYTCYTEIDSTHSSLRFSLSIGDIDVEKVIVGVSSSNGVTKSYELTNTAQTIEGLSPYPSGTTVILPNKNAGLTYETSSFEGSIDSISIAPVIGGTQCDVSDSIQQIGDCTLMEFE